MHDHLRPDRTLVVDMGALNGGFTSHHDRYPDGEVVRFDGTTIPNGAVAAFLDGLDLVYSAETFYDWRIVDLAHSMGVATVLHVMPEFFRHHGDHGLPTPSTFWNPTEYLMDRLPPGTSVVPIPVDGPRLAGRAAEAGKEGPIRALHVAGHQAMADRNGTSALLNAVRRLDASVHLTITTQNPKGIRVPPVRSGQVEIEVTRGDVADYADLYDGHHLMVMPRRYAGLCLPVQEALGAGLAVAMTDTAPNRRWPILPIPVAPAGYIRCQAGLVPVVNAAPAGLRQTLTRVATNRDRLAEAQSAAREWAAANTWDVLGPLWRGEMEAAVARFRA